MSYEEKALICVECNNEFAFTAGEQEFFAEKGFTSEPKRCKSCRAKRKKRGKKGDGIYRSPAFEGSAPSHQRIRGRGRSNEYRAPLSGGRGRQDGGDYRSPAFREHDHIKPDQEYRAPGFQEYASIKTDEEYRAPGFKEHADLDVRAEYRSPGFQDLGEKYRDEKPEFAIICAECGVEAMVPFLPEERENPLCQECYKAQRQAATETASASEAGEPKTEPDPKSEPEPKPQVDSPEE